MEQSPGFLDVFELGSHAISTLYAESSETKQNLKPLAPQNRSEVSPVFGQGWLKNQRLFNTPSCFTYGNTE